MVKLSKRQTHCKNNTKVTAFDLSSRARLNFLFLIWDLLLNILSSYSPIVSMNLSTPLRFTYPPISFSAYIEFRYQMIPRHHANEKSRLQKIPFACQPGNLQSFGTLSYKHASADQCNPRCKSVNILRYLTSSILDKVRETQEPHGLVGYACEEGNHFQLRSK